MSQDELEPGITVYNSKTSAAFMLIAFMVGDLILVYKNLKSPINLSLYKELDEEKFTAVKNKILKNQSIGQVTHLNMKESISLYFLVDTVCKCFVNDANDTLKKLALENIQVSDDEYEKLRMNFLRYAQSLIEKMNEKFSSNKIFSDSLSNLKK